MRSQYTTSLSAVDDRFEYSRRGIFRCRNPYEIPYTIMTIIIIVLCLSIIYAVSIHASANLASVLITLIFDILKIVSPIASVLILVGMIRVILSGDQYNFVADEQKMLIVCPKRDVRADIYYSDVLNVEYTEKKRFSKLIGYDVNIYCKGGIHTFRFLFPYRAYKKNKDLTPFIIIEERAGLLERPEFLAGKRIDNAGINEER